MVKKFLYSCFLACAGSAIFLFTCATTTCSYPLGSLNTILQQERKVELDFTIAEPKLYKVLDTSFEVQGFSRIADVLAWYRVYDDAGTLLATGSFPVQTSLLGEWHSFTTEITLQKAPSVQQGILEIYQIDKMTGKIKESILVPVRFKG